jgi:transcriptional antiterminator NusG
VVRNTDGVTGFVGASGKPTPLPEEEVDGVKKFMELDQPKIEVKFKKGDSVKITDGAFADFVGEVREIDEEKGRLKVLVTIFGRETPVDLDFLQVEPL